MPNRYRIDQVRRVGQQTLYQIVKLSEKIGNPTTLAEALERIKQVVNGHKTPPRDKP